MSPSTALPVSAIGRTNLSISDFNAAVCMTLPWGKWIRTFGSAILIMLRKTGLSEPDQYKAEQGVGRIPA
jgi:hypothetical protein